MSGHVLIIDAMSNRRIRMQAVLDTACYKLSFAETQLDGLSQIKSDVPDVVIIAHDLPGLKLVKFCQLLRDAPALQFISVVVAVPRENQSARLAALSAGAADVIEYSVDKSELQARIRNYVRTLQASQEIRQRTGPTQDLGFSEDQVAFASAYKIAIVRDSNLEGAADKSTEDTHWAGANITHVSHDAARRGLPETCDVIVLYETKNPAERRDTLGTLRTQAVSRHASILYVTSETNEFDRSPLDLGAQDQVSSSVTTQEIQLRIKRLANRKRIEDSARAEISILGEKAYKDAMTGLHNRRYAMEYLGKQDRLRAEHPSAWAILMVDIDHFKRVNDTHGHAAGDEILVQLATALKSHLRDGDMIARYGGEEFLVVLTNIGANEARSVADRLRKKVASQPMQFENGTHVWTTVSIGLAHANRSNALGSKDMISAADAALYRAKSAGRNNLWVAAPGDYIAYRHTAGAAK